MRKFIMAAVAVTIVGLMPQIGHAQKQNTNVNSKSAAGAVAGAEAVGAIFMPGALGGVPGGASGAAAAAASAGGFNQPQLIMNSTNAPSTSTFNDCGIAWSGALWLVSMSMTNESKECVAQREAIFAANVLGMKDVAFERMCDNAGFRASVARTNGPQCAATIAERNKNAPPVAVAPVAQPVVASNGWQQQCPLRTMPNGTTAYMCQ